MIFCADIREKKTGNTIKTVLKTASHDEAYQAVNEYNKEYGTFAILLQEYPKKKYFIDIYKDEIE
ncbi:hypothetical protein [Clostridium rectalis]|uniref:hypothetical protein n=1 Tax=Clostridium rectalis TaxID=2040295 RepID=UPI000F6342EF|nr:hypothetical protein [Clostridium rectalis]